MVRRYKKPPISSANSLPTLRKPIKLIMATAVTIVAAAAVYSCHSLDDDRIPVQPVNISFATVADWNIYGVNGALEWRRFIH